MRQTQEGKALQLGRYCQELRSLLDRPPAADDDLVLERALERMVQLLVECAADAGDLWLSDHGQPLGQSAMGVFQNLYRAGVLSAEVLERFRSYVTARNRIIHDYETTQPARVRADAERLAADIPPLIQALLGPGTPTSPA